ncbi:MAG TPA: glycoside hydrolase [Firmicutes bacterium]|nr:glycoside hydrolase [Bacillota bacterium]
MKSLVDVSKYVGVPYKHNGRSIQEGLDCWGLVMCVFAELGVTLPGNDGINIPPEHWFRKDADRYWRFLQTIGKPLDISEVKRYDIVYFAMIGNSIVSHAGVMLDDKMFIHTLQKRNCFISKLDRYWLKKIRGARRLPEVAHLQPDC